MAAEEYLPPVVTRLQMDIGDFLAKAKAAKKIVDSLGGTTAVIVNMGGDAQEKADELKTTLDSLSNRSLLVDLDTSGSIGRIEALKDSIESLASWEAGLEAAAYATARALLVQRDAAVEKGLAISNLSRRTTNLIKREAALAIAARAARDELEGQGSSAVTAATAINAVARGLRSNNSNSGSGFWTAFGLQGPGSLIHITDLLNATLPEARLFAGAIGDIYKAMSGKELPSFASHLLSVATSAHLTAEAGIEIAAVWGPALLALTAYGAAATPTLKAIALQLYNMHVASMATGQSFDSLATKGESVTKAVKPSVLEAFGIGLYTIQRDSGTLAPILASLGQSIDQIAARASAALTGTGSIWATGAKDAGLLMTAFGNVFGILGNLTRAVPGYAEVLLGFGTDVTGMAERVTGAISPMLAIFLKLHGAMLYGGLFGTAIAFGFAKIVSGASAATLAVLKFTTVTLGLSETGAVAKGISYIGLSLEALGSPLVLGGIGLVVGAIAAVVMYMKASKTAAQEFTQSLQQGLNNATADKLPAMLRSDAIQNAKQLAAAQQGLAAAQERLNQATAADKYPARGNVLAGPQGAVRDAQSAVNTYIASGKQLSQQTSNLNANLEAVSNNLGIKLPDALAVAGKAGVTSAQLLGTGKENLAEIEALIGGYIAQVKVMATGSGQLNSALNALNVTTSSQYQDIQDVTGAYSTWLGIVTGGDSAFTTFEQGQKTLTTDLKSGGETVKFSLGNIKDSLTTVKTALVGTSDSALAARQAFDSQVNSGLALYNALATQAAIAGNAKVEQTALARSGMDVVASMLPMAKGSQEATTELYALAQIVGYTGNNSYAGLSKWLGNTKNAAKDLDREQQILATTTANLSQDAKNLANGLNGSITQAMVNAIASTSNLNGATQGLTDAFNKAHGKITSQVQDMAQKYATSLMQMGIPNGQIEQALAALAGRFGMNGTDAQKWAATAVAAAQRVRDALAQIQSKTVTVTVNSVTRIPESIPSGVTSPAAVTRLARGYASGTSGAAAGWAWVGEAGPELVRFRGGETVIPNHVSRGYANGTDDYGTHNVHVYLDGKKIYSSVQTRAVNTQRRTGTNGLSKRTR